MSSQESPLAIWSKITETGMRVALDHGLPLQTLGQVHAVEERHGKPPVGFKV